MNYTDYLAEFQKEMQGLENKAEEVTRLTDLIKDYKIKIDKTERAAFSEM